MATQEIPEMQVQAVLVSLVRQSEGEEDVSPAALRMYRGRWQHTVGNNALPAGVPSCMTI